MAPPTFTSLPNEVLDEIIQLTLPDGFESLALTCKEIYGPCTRYIQYHNHLRSAFRDFAYSGHYPSDPSQGTFYRAFELIMRIADEPRVAQYIITADFSFDTLRRQPSAHRRNPLVVPDINGGGPVVALFANSTILATAGLDWREFYTKIQDQLAQGFYSQEAASFVLTLLPNVKRFTLPKLWWPLAEHDNTVFWFGAWTQK
ncbi:hypothetical protein F5Y09DRAFT_347053 [Xylaria sp. FL1042]|nr:hypothetical protein F5Y09DRAFT_347053 [Xylaria sp. FL1042]